MSPMMSRMRSERNPYTRWVWLWWPSLIAIALVAQFVVNIFK